jgi:hypothetical protein
VSSEILSSLKMYGSIRGHAISYSIESESIPSYSENKYYMQICLNICRIQWVCNSRCILISKGFRSFMIFVSSTRYE